MEFFNSYPIHIALEHDNIFLGNEILNIISNRDSGIENKYIEQLLTQKDTEYLTAA